MRIKYLPQDNEARINGGICRYDGEPYLISLSGADRVDLWPLYNQVSPTHTGISVNDERFDISSPPMGFLNSKNNALYLMRRPERNYKQTLKANVVTSFNPSTGMHLYTENSSQFIMSEAGVKMFRGEYPTLTVALEMMSKVKREGVAISRNVALVRHAGDVEKVWIYYKTSRVGELDMKTNTVNVDNGELAWVISKYLEDFQWTVK